MEFIEQAKKIKELTKLVEEQRKEINRLEKLNENLLRISRERANADRNLRPKKSRKSEFYEDMIKDHEWCQNPDDYNIALQPKLGIRRDYWYISMMLTKGVRAFPADLRRI